VLDTRGLAQVFELFTRTDREPPVFVFHELALTDGAGHDYGPHHPGLRAALAESDRRVARVLDLLEQRGLLDETLLVLTADHGMAPQDVALRANPARHVERIGMAAVVAEPMIWLRDLALEVERAADGRTARVIVLDGDPLPSGEHPPVEGAEVVVLAHDGEVHAADPGGSAGGGHRLAHGRTGPGGVFGFATPSDVASGRMGVSVHAHGFNPRHLRLDGRSLAPDPRHRLYGAR
jgi:arylsulfatase A-like enzyme